MIINSNGKIFGKVSIIDILIVLLVIIAIVAAYLRLNKNVDKVADDPVDFYYTISIKEIRENNKDNLIKDINKEFFLNGDVSHSMGILESYEILDAKSTITLTDGSVVESVVPEKYDVYLTFKINGFEMDDGYYTSKLHDLCAGKSYSISSLHCSVFGTVDKIWK